MKKYINPYHLFVGSFLPNWLLKQEKTSPGAKLCYARLCQFSGRDGECFPAQATLATEIGAGERQIRRYLSELEDQGLIDIIQVGLNQPNHYRFLWRLWMEIETEVKKETFGKGGKRRDYPDRTDMSTPDRTNPSTQERLYMSGKENQLRESLKTTTGVVVDEEKIERVKKALAPDYSKIPDSVLARLIREKGIEHCTSYQLRDRRPTRSASPDLISLITLPGISYLSLSTA
jgi:DNA-binding Lrp family transcriptional regulator